MNATKQPFFTISKFTKAGKILTKVLRLVDGKVQSDSGECKMTRGVVEKLSLPLSELPDLLHTLDSNCAVALGVVADDHTTHEIMAAKQYESRGYSYPSVNTPTGVYTTRTLESIKETKGKGLVVFDYDPDPSSPDKRDITPAAFLAELEKVIPGISRISYVRTYSTSSGIKLKSTNEWVTPPRGFHIYMVMKDGRDLKRFGKELEKRLFLGGLGYVKLAKNGNALKRTIVDVAVFSPERLIFEAGAVIEPTQDIYQDRPAPEFVQGDLEMLDTKVLQSLSDEEELVFQNLWADMIGRPQVQSLQNKIREDYLDILEAKAKQKGVKFNRGFELRNLLMATLSRILAPDQLIKFEDGREVTVEHLVYNPQQYDQLGCLDPTREDKGFGRSRFYANLDTTTGICNPKVHSFVTGSHTYNLRDSVAPPKLEAVIEDLVKSMHRVTHQHSRYVEHFDLVKGVTFIKAEKGVGKSTVIAQMLPHDARALAITPRISLTNTIASKLDLVSYQEEFGNEHQMRIAPRLATTLNSLFKVEGNKYEYVIIEEGTLLLRSLKSKTLSERVAVLRTLKNVIANADYVFFIDADTTSEYVDLMLSEEFGLGIGDRALHLVYNDYKPAQEQGRKVRIYEDDLGRVDDKLFLTNFVEAARAGGVMYCSNSRKDCLKKAGFVIQQLTSKVGEEAFAESLVPDEHFITECGGRRIITITSQNSSNPEVKDFIDNINSMLLPTDVLICSPSLGTGVSIDAIASGSFFPSVFARFDKRSGNTPQDCSQHMARVRECTDYHLAILDTKQKYPVDLQQITQQLFFKITKVDELTKGLAVLNFDPAKGTYTFKDEGWLQWCAQLTSLENKCRNDFRPLLIAHLEFEGYKLLECSGIASTADVESYKELATALKEHSVDLNKNAKWLTDSEAEMLRLEQNHTAEELRQLRKKYVEQYFGFLDADELSEFCGYTDEKIAQFRLAAMLRADLGVLLVNDMVNRVDAEKLATDKTINYQLAIFCRRFLRQLGITYNAFGVPNNQELELTAIDKDEIYMWMYENASLCKGYLNIGVKWTTSRVDRAKLISAMLAVLGLKFSRATKRIEGVPEKVSVICPEIYAEWVVVGNRAVEYSGHMYFAGLTSPPKSLLSFTYNLISGAPMPQTPEFEYILSLNQDDFDLLKHTLMDATQKGILGHAA